MALGFIPLALVRMNLNALIQSQRSRVLQNQYAVLQEFYDYFQNNYINRTFPPRMWNFITERWSFAQIILWKVFIKGGSKGTLLYGTSFVF